VQAKKEGYSAPKRQLACGCDAIQPCLYIDKHESRPAHGSQHREEPGLAVDVPCRGQHDQANQRCFHGRVPARYLQEIQHVSVEPLRCRGEREAKTQHEQQNKQGIALLQEGKLDDARKYFERATKVNKRFSDAYNNLGATYYAEKQYKKAISQYQRSLSLQPNVASVYTNVGYAYFAQKQLPKAMEAFHKALTIDPHVFEETGRSGSILSYRSVTDRGLFNFMLAKDYAQNGDAANCVVYLRRAAGEGYKEVGKVRTDPAFARVVADPDIKALLDEISPLPPPPPPAARPGS